MMIGDTLYILRHHVESELRNGVQRACEVAREARALLNDARETKRLLRARADLYEGEAKRQHERADLHESSWKAYVKLYEGMRAERDELQKKVEELEEEKRNQSEDETVRSRPSPLRKT